MSVSFNDKSKTFSLNTSNTSYMMQIAETGHLLHTYYGSRIEDDCDYLYPLADRGFSPNPYELREARNWSLDQLPQEISTANCGDYRISTLDVYNDKGLAGCNLTYVRHEISGGKYKLEALPSARSSEDVQTLAITMADEVIGIELELLYAVYENVDVITRALRIRNVSDTGLWLEQAASVCLDIPYGVQDMIHFHGRHVMEMQKERISLPSGITTISSSRGMTSHQHNPFVICLEKETDEDHGVCYGIMLEYSGSYSVSAEKDQSNAVRVVAGINENHFAWKLNKDKCFETPEAILSFSGEGISALSHNYHDFIRNYIIERPEGETCRQVLLNSWEALYCDYDESHMLELAKAGRDMGAELFVMDDGWFGNRYDDRRSLGDWHANPKKFPRGLKATATAIKDMGLDFGLWIEPEMVSEESGLIEEHPEWVLRVPGRRPAMGREQLVLDLSRREVCDHLYEVISGILDELPVSYVKWDMNRGLSDLYSPDFSDRRMREIPHRYLLGLYELLDRLKSKYPEILFEGCAGGGGRFDAGMMNYFPQIWTSDNSDAVARLSIQHGASYGYPVSAMGAHVSAVPNHQTGRTTSLGVRGMVAMSGSFGYELDPMKLSEEERAEIKTQIKRFKEYSHIIHDGDYYRLTDREYNKEYCAWQHVSKDKSETVLNLVITETQGNANAINIRLKGLKENSKYRIEREEKYGDLSAAKPAWLNKMGREGLVLSGAALMKAGLSIAPMQGDYPGVQYYIKEV